MLSSTHTVDLTVNILILGDQRVGKTSLMQRLVGEKFTAAPLSTTETQIKPILLDNVVASSKPDMRVKVNFYDKGQNKSELMSESSFDLIVLVYDIHKQSTLNFLKTYLEQHALCLENALVLIANKYDAENESIKNAGITLAAQYAIPFYAVSALKNDHLQTIFTHAVATACENALRNHNTQSRDSSNAILLKRFQPLKTKIRNEQFPATTTLTNEQNQQIEQKTADRLIEMLKKELLDLKAKLKKESRPIEAEEEEDTLPAKKRH